MTHHCHGSTTFFAMNMLGVASININNEHFKLLVYDEFPTFIDDMATWFEVVGPYCESTSTTNVPMQIENITNANAKVTGELLFQRIKTKSLNPFTIGSPLW
jgi:hypothetical protein